VRKAVLAYALKRLIAGLVTVLFIATATFAAMHAVPGDPLSQTGKAARNPAILANLKARYGLDRPVVVQYGVFLKNMAKGDFGISFTQQNRSVNDIIREHFPVSAVLGVLSLLFATVGGIVLGSLSARFRGGWTDRTTLFLVVLGISVPGFVFAALAQYGVIELNKMEGTTVLPIAGWGTLAHMLLPALTLGLGTLAFLTRLMRSSLLEIVNQDYVRTAKAKGLPPWRIFLSHQLRNGILPVVTLLGPALAAITTGGFVVESVFAIPGLGRYFVQAVQQLDYTVIMGLTVFYGAFLVLMVIVVDIVYGLVDPRIRVAKEGA
jgi:ABC-type dipeptide/oligopeptide/nickel transport system permease component